MKVAELKTVGNELWQAVITPDEETILRLSSGQQELLRLKPLTLGNFSEFGGIVNKFRVHEKIDRLSSRVEINSRIPFGSEPDIKRDIVFSDGFARVIVDVSPGSRGVTKQLDLETLELPGKWRRAAVAEIPEPGQSIPALNWREVASQDHVFFNSPQPFLLAVFESETGQRLEIGAGSDIWRRLAAGKLPDCTPEYSISGNTEMITVKQRPLALPDDTETASRSWRFKWYFAWDTPGRENVKQDLVAMRLDRKNWPDSALVQPETADCAICLCAPAVRKKLRKSFRPLAARDNCHTVLSGFEPHLCLSASHLERGGQNELPHWDMTDFIDLYLWANRRATTRGGAFKMDVGKLAGDLPSLSNVQRFPFGNIREIFQT